MAFTSFVDHAISIKTVKTLIAAAFFARTAIFCICKFKLIAFLGNYSMYCIRPDPLRASGYARLGTCILGIYRIFVFVLEFE